MNEEELKKIEEALNEREGELAKKEDELRQREADAENIGATMKAEYEKRLESQKAEYERRLQARDDVIKQLSSGQDSTAAAPSFMERLNERREKNNRKW